MKHIFKVFMTFFLIFYSTLVMADSWLDPEWKEMIDSSDVIVLVEFTTTGDFKAKAKPIKIYKGTLASNSIWISGFSNKYGPIDKKKKGQKYILFLTQKEFGKFLSFSNYKTEPKDKNYENYLKALKNGNAYSVWTPTSGDLRVKGNKVQYDLLQTTFYPKQKYSSLKEFEIFLQAAQKTDKLFQERLLDVLAKNPKSPETAKYIMMLYLSNFNNYQTIFKDIANTDDFKSCYALSKLLGQIKDETSRGILVNLLDHENSIVQGEAVKQLSCESVDFIGPILLKKLKKAGDKGIYSQDIMNPVMNSFDGGKIEIIKTLGELGYKPAIPDLLPLLETDNEYLFRTTIRVLIKLGTKDYIPYLNKYLESGKRDFVLDICYIITENELSECIPSLMQFVANHDKTIHPSMEYTIDKYSGLSHFPTDTVKSFLYSDFLNVLKMEGGGTIDNKKDWVEEYMDVFVELEIDRAKPSLYDFMFDYYGINSDFKNDTSLFLEKMAKEDSIKSNLAEELAEYDIKEIKCLAFIEKQGDSIKLTDYTAKINFNSSIDFQKTFESIDSKGLNRKKILLTFDYTTHTHGAKDIYRFGDNLMRKFLDYLASYPDRLDVEFMENLKKYNIARTDYDKKQLDKYILKANERLIKK